MRAITNLPAEEARDLRAFLFDLDDTLLDRGALPEVAYSALFELRRAGLVLLAVTGRPSGWGSVLARQWPVDGVVTENGAIAHRRRGHHIECLDTVTDRSERSGWLDHLVEEMLGRFGQLTLADDNDARRSDRTFDIGERRHVPKEIVDAAEHFARSRGARTTRSSVHLHVTRDGDDKASGAVRFLRTQMGIDATSCRTRSAFIGDSDNDSACFAAFRTTMAVRNFTGRPTVPPRFITRGSRSAGFVEAARVILNKRA